MYIPPFDHPDVWEGNSTLIHEAKRQLPVRIFVSLEAPRESVGWCCAVVHSRCHSSGHNPRLDSTRLNSIATHRAPGPVKMTGKAPFSRGRLRWRGLVRRDQAGLGGCE